MPTLIDLNASPALSAASAATEQAWAAVVASANANGLPWGTPSAENRAYDRCVRELLVALDAVRSYPDPFDLARALFG